MKKYLLTIEGQPAFFCDYQIFYAGKRITTDQMEKTLYLVRKKIELSQIYRMERGFEVPKYGYVVVYINNL